MVENYAAAAESLLAQGYAILTEEALQLAVHDVFSKGLNFFNQPDKSKMTAATPSRMEGYRPLGAEFSESPDRPDLCEYFTVWPGNALAPEVAIWAEQAPLHAAMSRVLPLFSGVANGVMNELRQLVNPLGHEVDTAEASYLQMNFYRPKDFERAFLQDAHEDGHVLTVLKPTAPGLEVLSNNEFTHLDIRSGEVIILTGSILTLITGGLVPPCFHRVRNDRKTITRQTLLHFVNPSLSKETSPWVQNESNHNISICAIARSCIGGR